tara:strand:+ start:1423 stop:1707 length:285 start_codon:yes stop_codon:yes gene_type:complete
MITDNEIYAISGKDLKQFVHLVSDLKDVAMDYTKRVNELDIKETELSFDNFIQNLLNSRIFKNVNVLDLQEEFSFYELLKSTGVFTKSWGNKKF